MLASLLYTLNDTAIFCDQVGGLIKIGKGERSGYNFLNIINHLYLCDGSSDRSFMADPLSYFSFQPVFHKWCNKGRGMCYPLCGMMHIKEPLLLIGKSSPCVGSGFPLSKCVECVVK